jgi:tetratricopeptide (TPR) repeat protein
MREREPITSQIPALWSAWWKTPWLPLTILSLVVWATFGHLAANDLMFDDLDVIKNNKAITSLRNLRLLFSKDYFLRAPEGGTEEYSYRPVVTVSYFLDHAIAGKKPSFYHIHNVILHHANVLLLFALFNLLGAGRWRAFAMALVFALHPLHAEAVIFPGFREDLQMTAGMLALSCCLAADRQRPVAAWILWAPVALAFALFAKEGALLLPAAWLAFDGIQNTYAPRPIKLPRRYLLLAVVLIAYIAIRFTVMANPYAEEIVEIDQLPWKQRAITAPYLFAYSLRRFLWPPPLCIIPPIEPLKAVGFVFSLSVLLTAAFIILWIVLAQREKWLWFAGLWMGAAFAPVSNLYPIANLWAERFYYSVGVGTAAIAVVGVGVLWEHLARRFAGSRRLAFTIAGWTAVGFLAWLAAMYDLGRILECRTSLRLWRATVRRAPTSIDALRSCAIYEIEGGNFDRARWLMSEAEQHGEAAYRIRYVRAQADFREKKWESAIEQFEKALAEGEAALADSPPFIQRQINQIKMSSLMASSYAYREVGKPKEEEAALRKVLDLDPENPMAQKRLKQLETKTKDTPTTHPIPSISPQQP